MSKKQWYKDVLTDFAGKYYDIPDEIMPREYKNFADAYLQFGKIKDVAEALDSSMSLATDRIKKAAHYCIYYLTSPDDCEYYSKKYDYPFWVNSYGMYGITRKAKERNINKKQEQLIRQGADALGAFKYVYIYIPKEGGLEESILLIAANIEIERKTLALYYENGRVILIPPFSYDTEKILKYDIKMHVRHFIAKTFSELRSEGVN